MEELERPLWSVHQRGEGGKVMVSAAVESAALTGRLIIIPLHFDFTVTATVCGRVDDESGLCCSWWELLLYCCKGSRKKMDGKMSMQVCRYKSVLPQAFSFD